jgi:hypothetical protein
MGFGPKVKKNRNYDFEFLASGMEGFKWNFEFESKFLNFLKNRNLDIGPKI